MRALFVRPNVLISSDLFLRLEPLGLQRVAAAARDADLDVRLESVHHDRLGRQERRALHIHSGGQVRTKEKQHGTV